MTCAAGLFFGQTWFSKLEAPAGFAKISLNLVKVDFWTKKLSKWAGKVCGCWESKHFEQFSLTKEVLGNRETSRNLTVNYLFSGQNKEVSLGAVFSSGWSSYVKIARRRKKVFQDFAGEASVFSGHFTFHKEGKKMLSEDEQNHKVERRNEGFIWSRSRKKKLRRFSLSWRTDGRSFGGGRWRHFKLSV